MRISKKVILLYSFPFSLKMASKPLYKDRTKILCRWQNLLNSLYFTNNSWFLNQENIPIGVKIRKQGILELITDPMPIVKEQVVIRAKEIDIHLLHIKEHIYYYDFGIGGAELWIEFNFDKINDFETFKNFHIMSKKLARDLIASKALFAFYNWDLLNETLSNVFVKTKINAQPWLSSNYTGDSTGRLWDFSENLILQSVSENDENSMPFEKSNIFKFADRFCGDGKKSDVSYNPAIGLIACHHGYSGNFAIVTDLQSVRRVHYLWRYLTLYWAALSASTEAIYQRLLKITSEDPTSRKMKFELEQLKNTRQTMNFLIHECTPEHFCGDSFDRAIYGGLWDAWQTPELLSAVKERYNTLSDTLNDFQNTISQKTQDRINKILFIITLLTLIGLTSQIISFVDFKNSIFNLKERIILLVTTTSFFWFIVGLYLGFSLKKRNS